MRPLSRPPAGGRDMGGKTTGRELLKGSGQYLKNFRNIETRKN